MVKISSVLNEGTNNPCNINPKSGLVMMAVNKKETLINTTMAIKLFFKKRKLPTTNKPPTTQS